MPVEELVGRCDDIKCGLDFSLPWTTACVEVGKSV